MPLKDAGFSVTDLGVQRGYGIFDFLRVTDHVPLFQDDHLERFFNSAKEMRLPAGKTKEELKEIIAHLIAKNNIPHAGIRLLLSGGTSPDGYEIVQPNLALVLQPITPPSDQICQQGYKLVTYPHHRQMPHVKTTDYLMAIWINPWVKEKGADDVLYQQNGIISECPRSNFFIVTQSGAIVTPAKNILKGITRKQILLIAAEQGMKLEERDVSVEDIRQAKEAFISSSTKRIIPVVKIDDIVLPPFSNDSVTAKLYQYLLQREKGFQINQ